MFKEIKSHKFFLKKIEKYINKKEYFYFKDFEINNEQFRTYFYIIQPTIEVFLENSLLLELRGITFSLDRDIIVSRPLHKFFNIEEWNFSEKQLSNIFNNIKQIQTKLDGSMIHPFLLKDGEIEWKTKKSPFSDVTIDFKKFIKNQNWYNDFIKFNKFLLNNNYTPIYEYWENKNKIVIEYKNPFVKILAIRHNFIGNYLEFENIEDLRQKLNYYDSNIYLTNENIPKRWNYNINSILSMRSNLEQFEGFVIVTNSGERYKIKTQWYFQHHRISTSFNDKIILEAILNNKIDDLISEIKKINDEEKLSRIEHIKNEVDKFIINIQEKIEKYNIELKNKNQKEKAIYLNNKLGNNKDIPSKIIFSGVMKNENSNIFIFDMLNRMKNKFIKWFINEYLTK